MRYLLPALMVSLVLTGCDSGRKPDPEAAAPTSNPTPPAAEQPSEPAKATEPAKQPSFDPLARTEDFKTFVKEAAKAGAYETRGTKERPRLGVQFRSPGPKDADLARLRPFMEKLTVPISLNLNQCQGITEAGLVHLKDLPMVRELAFSEIPIGNDALKYLAESTELESLVLSKDLITDAGLAHLAKLTKLRRLSVYSAKLTPACFVHLAGMTELEELHIGGSNLEIGDDCLVHMKGMSKLKELKLGGSKGDSLTDAGMVHVSNFMNATKVWIESRKVTGAGLKHLAPLTKVESMVVMSVPGFTGEALAALSGMNALKELNIMYTPALDKAGGRHLGALKGLKKLSLLSADNDCFEGLAASESLETLDTGFARIGDDALPHIGKMTKLQQLNISGGPVTDAGLKHIVGMKSLKSFSASSPGITDEGLVHLAKLPSVESLGLSNCKITGIGLKHLAEVSNLKRIWLNGNPITDESVSVLKSFPKLESVILTGTKVSEETARAIKVAKPKLSITDESGDDVKLKPEVSKRSPVEDISKIEPAFKLSAEDLHKEYKENRNQTDAKYKGKVIELTGTVDSVSRNISGDPIVSLKVGNDFIGVMCVTADNEPWTKVARGQTVRLKGKWPDFNITASLLHCVFLDVGKYAALSMTAEELRKEFEADPEATSKKYDKKHILLSGEVLSKEYNSAGAATITLKTAGKASVTCSFTAFDKGAVKSMKEGGKVKVFGEYTLNFGKESTGLNFCLPVGGQ